MRNSKILVSLAVVGATIGIGGVVYATSRQDRPMFGIAQSSDDPRPEFSAVSGPDGKIAGYVNTDLIEYGPQPKNPEEAVALMEAKGNLFEVFDLKGEIVGYFGTGELGFVDAATKDRLLTEGYTLLRSSKPNEDQPLKDEITPPSISGK